MTLIAAVWMNTNPAVFGDLAISGPERPGRVTHIPTVGEATNVFPNGSGFAILALKQKVVLLGATCAISWSGTEIVARAVVRDLRELASQTPLSVAAIRGYISELDPIDQGQVSFVGWVHEGDHFEQFWYGASVGDGGQFGQVAAAGTGGDAFIRLASRVSANMPTIQDPLVTGLDRIVASLLSAMGLLLRAELASQSTLLHGFGGGYEIATFVGDRFEKVSDILFIFWSAVVTETQSVELKVPSLILKQDYDGETLLIQALRPVPGNTARPPLAMVSEKHVIGAFGIALNQKDARDIRWPGMEARYICHVVFVNSPNGDGVLTRINFSPSRASKDVQISVAGDDMTFWVRKEFCHSITESVRAEYVDAAT